MDADTTHHLFEALVNGATAINVSVEDLAALDLIPLDAARWHVRHGQTGYRVILRGQTNDYLGRIGGLVQIDTNLPDETGLRLSFGGMVRDP